MSALAGFAPEGGTILDPFGGSGSTAVGAIRCGRKAALIEIDPVHAATANGRIEAELAGQSYAAHLAWTEDARRCGAEAAEEEGVRHDASWQNQRQKVLDAQNNRCARQDCTHIGSLDVIMYRGELTGWCRKHRLLIDGAERANKAARTRGDRGSGGAGYEVNR